MDEKRKAEQPTVREKKLVKSLIEGESIREAGRQAGYAPSTCEGGVYAIIRRPRVVSFLTEAMDKAGITSDKLAGVLLDALEAKKTVFNPKLGELLTEYPDHDVRLKGYDRAVAAHGVIPRETEMPAPPPAPMVVIIAKASEHNGNGGNGAPKDITHKREPAAVGSGPVIDAMFTRPSKEGV